MIRNTFSFHLLCWAIASLIANITWLTGLEKTPVEILLFRNISAPVVFYSFWLLAISYHKQVTIPKSKDLSPFTGFKRRFVNWQCGITLVIIIAYLKSGLVMDQVFLQDDAGKAGPGNIRLNHTGRIGWLFLSLTVSYIVTHGIVLRAIIKKLTRKADALEDKEMELAGQVEELKKTNAALEKRKDMLMKKAEALRLKKETEDLMEINRQLKEEQAKLELEHKRQQDKLRLLRDLLNPN